MKIQISLALLFFLLTACASVVTSAPTETLIPTTVPPTLTTTVDIPTIITPSPMPTQPFFPAITPDSIQVEKWKEYHASLARKLLSYLSPNGVLCEWDILGISEQVLYVWAVCESITPFGTTSTGTNMYSSSSTPALIHLKNNQSIESIEIPSPGISDYPKLFPDYIQAKFEAYRFGRAKELSDHIEWRRMHPEEPPLIILSSIPTP